MRILITGATGFIGAAIAHRMAALDLEVHIFTRPSSNRWRIESIAPKLIEHHVDLEDEDAVVRAVTGIRPEYVFHAACYGGFSFQQHVKRAFLSNLFGTMHLLGACERTGFEAFVHFGSSSEYGVKDTPMSENVLLEPIGAYSVSKAAATLYCRSRAVETGLPVVTLRLFSPYGPFDDPQRLIPYVVSKLLRRQTPSVLTPSSVRDYIYIEDVLDICEIMLAGPVPSGEIVNLGSGVQYSIGEVVSILYQIIGVESQPSWGSLAPRRTESAIWTADTTRMKRLFLWEPMYDLETGLESTVEWIHSRMNDYL
ncbi:NAD-dependent epimerase/dehydratase family protein [Cohnella faecalis]|uniref:NAD-dependent epimerase/dehydratase family protein n=1 Tax=Cohnella faecalis TaxID=2315694 RepID=A0A398CUY4_9BACL|nr:NAD-dependent epimerase/dehydratase family protein [Cohnella faecalis]RIE02824.1 NAD-dependent epimerase/dehydratase family protein [Cohnella faecalis]